MGNADRRRRIDGWGFEGESFPPSAPMLAWIHDAIGPCEASSDPGPPATPPAPATLPDLGAPTSREAADRLAAARGQGFPDLLRLRTGRIPAFPDAVSRPGSDEEVAAVLTACHDAGAVVIPRGGGTSVTGGVNVPKLDRPVVVLELSRLRRCLDLDPVSGLATFEAGATGPEVESALGRRGFTLGHFPQSWELSTVGGWIVTRSSGQQSMGYGRIGDMVAGLEVVAPRGRLRLPALPASAAGPDLRQLILGSEGRFGIVTRATLRVRPRPETLVVEAALLHDWESGLVASRELVREGIGLTMLRLSDGPETQVALTTGLADSPLAPLARLWFRLRGIGPEACLLLLGADGEPARVERALDRAHGVLARHRAIGLGRGPGRRWLADRFRHPYLRDGLLDRGIATDTLETAAPWSRLPALAAAVRSALHSGLEAEDERVAVLCHLSHPYPDGASLYFTFFFRRSPDPDETLARWARLKRAATEALVAEQATVSHHHGVGRWHAPWLEAETGASGLELLRAAASSLDPEGLLNPQVLLDPSDRLED